MGARVALVALIAVAAAILVVRNAFVASYAESDPARAASVWPEHPAVVFRVGLARIGEAAAAGRPVARESVEPLLKAARTAPLAPEPFLIRGVEVRLAGDEPGAGRAFAEAKRRDPRSIAARFFLADHHLRSGAVERGLGEVAVLTRLVPGSEARLAPVLAGYAQTPGAARQVKTMLRSHPQLESSMLVLLAADARNAELIQYLASDRRKNGGTRPGWQKRLVETLVADGQYAKAYAAWARLMDIPPAPSARPLLFDRRFQWSAAMPPFAWTLVSSGAGLVEPEKGGLHAIYYGRENVALASQTLLLAPGRYRLAMTVSKGGEGASSLAWTITCLPARTVVFSLDLAAAAATGGKGHLVDIPDADCAAQVFELRGKAPDVPQTVDLSLNALSLTREGQQ